MNTFFKKYFEYIKKEKYDQKFFLGLLFIICIISFMLSSIAPSAQVLGDTKINNIWCAQNWTYEDGTPLPEGKDCYYVRLHTDTDCTILRQTMQKTMASGEYLCFRTSAKSVKVFRNGSLLYSDFCNFKYTPFKPVTYRMYQIPLYGVYRGDELVLEIMPTNDDFIIQYFCIGDRYDIARYVFSKATETIIVCLFVLFLILLICTVYSSPSLTDSISGSKAMFWLAAFLLLAIVWMITENGCLEIMLTNHTVLYFLCNLSVFLMPVPFMQYTKYSFFPYTAVFDVLCILDMSCVTFSIIAFFLNVYDLKYTYVSIHLIIIAAILCYLYMIFKERQYPPVLVMIALVSLFISVFASIFSYWAHTTFPTSSYFGYGIIIYSICMFIWTLQNGVQEKKLRIEFERARLRQAKENAELANEQKTRFLSHMSHEIRTPLNAVLGMNELILKETNDEKVLRYAGNINQAGKTLLSLINDILDLSKIESGKMDIIPISYSISSVIHDMVAMMQVRSQDKNLELRLDIDPDIPEHLYGDEIRVKQVITNFMINAIKYTHSGWVKLGMHYEILKEDPISYEEIELKDKIMLIIEVSDSGIGIKEDDLAKLFENFERLDTLKNRSIEGTGLGLSITSQLVKLMNGTIDVISTYGEGSSFIARIPQEVIDYTPIGDYQKRFEESMKEEALEKQDIEIFPGYHVLIVDDNDLNLEVLSSLLEMMQINIETASNGRIALNKLRATQYDLILTDDMMPEVSGTELMQCIKKGETPKNSLTPIVVVTANAVQGMREEYLSKGFDGYLTKPLDICDLQKILRSFLN